MEGKVKIIIFGTRQYTITYLSLKSLHVLSERFFNINS